jgi:hypothetical protein
VGSSFSLIPTGAQKTPSHIVFERGSTFVTHLPGSLLTMACVRQHSGAVASCGRMNRQQGGHYSRPMLPSHQCDRWILRSCFRSIADAKVVMNRDRARTPAQECRSSGAGSLNEQRSVAGDKVSSDRAASRGRPSLSIGLRAPSASGLRRREHAPGSSRPPLSNAALR